MDWTGERIIYHLPSICRLPAIATVARDGKQVSRSDRLWVSLRSSRLPHIVPISRRQF